MSFTLDDELMLIEDKFGDYARCLAHCLIVLFFPIQYCVYKDIWYKLCSCESFFYKIFSNDFNHRLFALLDSLLASLLAKLAHNIGFLT